MRKETKKQKPKKKLQVRRDTVRELSTKDLEKVAGGYIQPTLTGHCYGTR